MKIDISDEDLHILFKKYEDRGQSKVNYMEFIRTIDPDSECFDFLAKFLDVLTLSKKPTITLASDSGGLRYLPQMPILGPMERQLKWPPFPPF